MISTETTSKTFLSDNFLLQSKAAERLYHNFAKDQPIIDYHNHLSPAEIAGNKIFRNISEAWLYGDHYKWRAMRTLGINEKYITGNGSDDEKFQQWGKTVPFTIRNPLFHWTHLELKRYFSIEELLNERSAQRIYESCNEKLNSEHYSTQGLLQKMNVDVVCSTDDPIDSLEHHKEFIKQGKNLRLFPTFRPDKSILINSETYIEYIEKLGDVCQKNISDYSDLIQCLKSRMEYFEKHGCKVSDHGINKVFGREVSENQLNSIFQKRLSGHSLGKEEMENFIAGIMTDLGRIYADRGWIMQLHLGALRNNNARMLNKLGPDTGFDSIGDYAQAEDLSFFLNKLDSTDQLPKTIIYNLNPADNEVMASMIGNFNDGSVKGKIQYGSAWWFLDQKDGMEKQINALSNMGLLSCFIGMLTDSRSFLSFPRHEYFRRILCNLIGRDVANGELPEDYAWLGGIVKDICYNNAKNYFNF